MGKSANKAEGTTATLDEPQTKGWTPPKQKMAKARILNKGLDEGIDYAFNWRRAAVTKPDGSKHRFPILRYHLVNGEIYTVPEALLQHLEQLSYPVRKYKENAPEGESMPVAGSFSRFSISRI